MIFNHWWRGGEHLWEDLHLSQWRNQPVRWMPEVMEALRSGLKPFALNFLSGPRQVGKSTALKLLVKELIEGGRDPSSIFYCQCDMLSTAGSFSKRFAT